MTEPMIETPPAIESPCILVCAIEPVSGHCRGCGRTTREIGAWGMFTPEQRRTVMDALPARMEALPPPPRERRINRRRAVQAESSDG